MPSDSDNSRLVLWTEALLRRQVRPDLLRRLDSIHHRHIEICKDQPILQPVSVGQLHQVESFLPIDAEVGLVRGVDALRAQDRFHGAQAELLVVSHENPAVLVAMNL
eukprot:CAMPEP_0170504980 /NCGR_PEP_ID=MMETSP0208-20121228/49492_1 /TAXON_ID=197538 /ORGANISM="Strombidium inclinatum, Strain S3" /LENGTH=106 /DNA_ID=CAMNT_0010785547 /DNA_START=59 /DNA_END=379 /DNA_ORIENTATION=+